MRAFRAAYVALYLLLTAAYCYTASRPRSTMRRANKTGLATLYFLFGAISWIQTAGRGTMWLLVLLLGLALCVAGDVVLMFSFVKGAICFFGANVTMLFFELIEAEHFGVPLVSLWPALPATAAAIFAVKILAKRHWLRFGSFQLGAMLYLLSITLSGMTGICLALRLPGGPRILGIGLGLFMISDYVLFYREFRKKRQAAQLLNTLTYFPGMLLIALSVSYF